MGLPGSGKSTISRYISENVRNRLTSITRINDFTILHEMFLEDTQGQFEPTAYGGFNVIDLTAFDTALRKLEQKVEANNSPVQLEELILIEFSRNDYENAFRQFSQEFLKDAYFLYLSAELDICKRRVQERINHPSTSDDHFVSAYIFNSYYNGDNGKALPQILGLNFRIGNERVRVIENNGALEEITTLIEQFVDTIFPLEIYRLQDTEPIQEVKDEKVEGELEQNGNLFNLP